MKIIVVDIETGGFKSTDPIFEVGIASLDLENGSVETLYDELVYEKDRVQDFHAKSWIFQNSDLNFEDVLKAKPFDTEAIQKIFSKYPATAFSKAFDFRFLKERGIVIKELDCPMLISTNICKLPGKFGKYKWPKVEEAWKYFMPSIPYVELHRGADDAVHEAKIVYQLYLLGAFKVPGAGKEQEK